MRETRAEKSLLHPPLLLSLSPSLSPLFIPRPFHQTPHSQEEEMSTQQQHNRRTASFSSSSSSSRIVKSLVIDSFTHLEQGLTDSTLYCKVVIPTSTTSSNQHVLIDSFGLLRGDKEKANDGNTRLNFSKVFELPLKKEDDENKENEEEEEYKDLKKKAIEYLEIVPQTLVQDSDEEEEEQGKRRRRSSRRRRSTITSSTRTTKPSFEARFNVTLEPDDKVYLNYSYKGQEQEEDQEEELMVELIVILSLQTKFGIFKEPKFSNIVTLPIPQCLRNSLRLTLPPPPSPTSSLSNSSSNNSWDLKINPSLSNVQSFPSTSNSTLLIGSFPSCSIVSIRFTKQQQQHQSPFPLPLPPPARFLIPSSEIKADWNFFIADNFSSSRKNKTIKKGNDREKEIETTQVELKIKGEWNYNGLRDKHWIELKIENNNNNSNNSNNKVENGKKEGGGIGGKVEVRNIEGVGVLGWEIFDNNNQTNKQDKESSGAGAVDTSDEFFMMGSEEVQQEEKKDSQEQSRRENQEQEQTKNKVVQDSSETEPESRLLPSPSPTRSKSISGGAVRRRFSSSSSMKYNTTATSSTSSRLAPKWTTSLFDTKPPPITALLDSSTSFSELSESSSSSLPVFTHAHSKISRTSNGNGASGSNDPEEGEGGGRGGKIMLLSQEKAPFNDSDVDPEESLLLASSSSKLLLLEQEEEDVSFELNGEGEQERVEEGDEKRIVVEEEEGLLLDERLEVADVDDSILVGEEELIPIAEELVVQKIKPEEKEEEEEDGTTTTAHSFENSSNDNNSLATSISIRIQVSISSLILQHLSSSSSSSQTPHSLPEFSLSLKLAFPNSNSSFLTPEDLLSPSPSSPLKEPSFSLSPPSTRIRKICRISLPNFSIVNSESNQTISSVSKFLNLDNDDKDDNDNEDENFNISNKFNHQDTSSSSLEKGRKRLKTIIMNRIESLPPCFVYLLPTTTETEDNKIKWSTQVGEFNQSDDDTTLSRGGGGGGNVEIDIVEFEESIQEDHHHLADGSISEEGFKKKVDEAFQPMVKQQQLDRGSSDRVSNSRGEEDQIESSNEDKNYQPPTSSSVPLIPSYSSSSSSSSTKNLSQSLGVSTTTTTISQVFIEITPISPTLSLSSTTTTTTSTSDWRIFYRLEIKNQQGIKQLTIPISSSSNNLSTRREESRVEIHNVWDTEGRSINFNTDHVVGGGRGEDQVEGIRISTTTTTKTKTTRGIREVLYEERKAGEDIEGAALLPFLEQRVAKYQVKVFEAQGYDLNVVIHDFDLSTKKLKDSSDRLFTKFLVPSNSRPFLPLRFRPITTIPSSSSTTTTSLKSPSSSTRTNPFIRSKLSSLRDLVNLTSLIALLLLLVSLSLSNIYNTYSSSSSIPTPTALHEPSRSPSPLISSATRLLSKSTTNYSPSLPLPLPLPLLLTPTSYSTFTKTLTSTQFATITSTSTKTRIQTVTEFVSIPSSSLSSIPLQSFLEGEEEESSLRMVSDNDDDDDDEHQSLGMTEGGGGNPVLVWLEKLRIGWKEIFQDFYNSFKNTFKNFV